MIEELAIEKFKTLSLERQQEVLDFIEFLQAKQASETIEVKSIDPEALKTDWQSEPFFGIWRNYPFGEPRSNREDMKDSAKWVKQIRQQQWNG